MIVRLVPEISLFVTNVWGSPTTGNLLLAGNGSTRVEPVFLCGQQAAVIAYGQMAKPTFRKEDDYGFITGTGIEAAYGVGKMFKKHPKSGTKLNAMGRRNRVLQLGVGLIARKRRKEQNHGYNLNDRRVGPRCLRQYGAVRSAAASPP